MADEANGTRYELAGPETLTHQEIVELALRSFGRRRPIVHVPLPVVRRGLRLAERLMGPAAFATWDEAQLMEIPMIASNGSADAERLGVAPKPMRRCSGSASGAAPRSGAYGPPTAALPRAGSQARARLPRAPGAR